ncbi:hypothetical protein L6R29_12810 [Myxococcota bacterium]|nr:hypothetical protein [Myxococcota bacterium]
MKPEDTTFFEKDLKTQHEPPSFTAHSSALGHNSPLSPSSMILANISCASPSTSCRSSSTLPTTLYNNNNRSLNSSSLSAKQSGLTPDSCKKDHKVSILSAIRWRLRFSLLCAFANSAFLASDSTVLSG